MIDDIFVYVAGGECLHAGQGWGDGDKGPIRGREKGFPSYLISLVILGSPNQIKLPKRHEENQTYKIIRIHRAKLRSDWASYLWANG